LIASSNDSGPFSTRASSFSVITIAIAAASSPPSSPTQQQQHNPQYPTKNPPEKNKKNPLPNYKKSEKKTPTITDRFREPKMIETSNSREKNRERQKQRAKERETHARAREKERNCTLWREREQVLNKKVVSN